MLTIPVVLSGLALILSYAVFQFGLFKWLIGRIDLLGSNFKDELVRHAEADVVAMKEIHNELQAIRALKSVPPKRVR